MFRQAVLIRLGKVYIMFSFKVFSLVSVVSPSVDSFIVKGEDGSVDKHASVEALLGYIDELGDSAGNMAEFQEHLVKSVNDIVCSKKKGVRVSVADLSSFLANRYAGDSADALSEAPVIADWIAKFVKDHCESSNEKHVASGKVHWHLQEKGKGAGILLIEDKPALS